MKCFFFIPGTSERFRSGGLMVIQDVAHIINSLPDYESIFVTTHEKSPGAILPEEAFAQAEAEALSSINRYAPLSGASLFFVTWGPLVGKHIHLIKEHLPKARIVYYAQSFGWHTKMAPDVAIVCVSRFVMSQWALAAPSNFCAYIPPPLHDCFSFEEKERDIDVLVHLRKQNAYCREKLIPSLQKTAGAQQHKPLRVEIIKEWIPQEEYAALLKRSKIFLYCTELHKAGLFRRLPGEGFGLPALEALACGALVGSNLLGGVTDFLEPGMNCVRVVGDLTKDIAAVKRAVESFSVQEEAARKIVHEYSEGIVTEKWRAVLTNISRVD